MSKVRKTSSGLVAAAIVAVLVAGLPVTAGAAEEIGAATVPIVPAVQGGQELQVEEVTASELALLAPDPGEELVDQQGESFLPPEPAGPALLSADVETEFAAARAELDSEIAIAGVTWDPAETPTPRTVQLRYLKDGVWSGWEELGLPEALEAEEGAAVTGTDEYILVDAQSVEAVAFGENGEPLDEITLNIIDPLGGDEVVNELEVAEAQLASTDSDPDEDTSAADDGQSGSDADQGDAPNVPEAEQLDGPDPSEQSLDDETLDLDGAASVEPAGFASSVNTASVAPIIPAAVSTNYLGLKIGTRADWAADEKIMTWKPESITYKGAVIHHTEGSNDYTQAAVPGLLRGIYYYHAVTRGWGDIGYQFLVDKYGGVWEGRAGGITKMTEGAQAYGANQLTFGISILGSYTGSVPPVVAQDAVAKTIAWKLNLHGIKSIDGTISVPGSDLKGRSIPIVSGHRDVGATDCPGNAYYNILPQMRTKVKAYMKEATGTEQSSTPSASFPYGEIISDEVFYNGTAMTAAQIQTFLNTQGKDCKASGDKTCLKNTKFATKNLLTDRGGCKPLKLTGSQTAATIIAETAKACSINPQVILANIQKESSGIYQPLNAAGWAKVMGSGCPDGKPCDPAEAGFTQQIYYGTDKLASYRLSQSWPYIAAVKSGAKVTIPYAWNKPSCGGHTFVIKNLATASLYTYTPFVPNAAALPYPAAGDSCSSTGWRNFHHYMTLWFPASMKPQEKVVPVPTISGTVRFGATVTAAGADATSWKPAATLVTYQWLRNGSPISKATKSTYVPTLADVGKNLSVRVTGMNGALTTGTATSKAQKVAGPTIARLSGADRYATSLAVYKSTGVKGKPLFVATGAVFADSLSAGPAVASVGGSLLLTRPGGLTNAQIAQVKANAPSAVYIVGGTGAVSEAVANQLRAATGKTPERVGGSNRYSTSEAIYDRFFSTKSGTQVLVATGRDYPDALSASAAGGATSTPVILVDGMSGQGLPTSLAATLKAKKRTGLVLVGGTGVVTPQTATALGLQGFSTTRLSGTNRYTTNQKVNAWVDGKQPSTAVTNLWFATGADFPDALSAGVPAGKAGHRLVLAKLGCVPKPVVSSSIKGSKSKVDRVWLVGGTGVLNASVASLQQCP